jgi:elongator complex protein 1
VVRGAWFGNGGMYSLIVLSGAERFEEAIAYITKYDLYNEALKLWAGESEQVKVSCPFESCPLLTCSQAIYDIYGDYLFDKREYSDAALAYVLGGKPERAMSAYEKAHAWRELFALASKQTVQGSELEDICDRVSGTFG